jgi:signal transduction histidine kinase
MRRRAAAISLSGEPERLPLGPAHDEIRRLGETLNEMLDRLRRSFERERRFVADASHELRSPIAVIKTELEGVLRSGGLGGEQREALVAAVEECDRLAALAEDLLVLARSADGRLPVRPEPLGVPALLEGARQRFVDRAAEHGRAIRVEAPADLVVMADELRVRQALANLVDNAIRHGDGVIDLRARAAPDGVEIDVTDHGAGFGPDLAARAFERFTRASESRSGDGAGLGLAIVQAIAAAHGGSAAIVEGPGGTTVRLTLPAGAPEHATPPAPAATGADTALRSHVPLI